MQLAIKLPKKSFKIYDYRTSDSNAWICVTNSHQSREQQMNISEMNRYFLWLLVGVFTVFGLHAQDEEAETEPEVETEEEEGFKSYPPELWAANPNMATVRVSPDGKYLSWISYDDATSTAGPTILVYDLTAEDGNMELVHRQKAEHMQIQTYSWISPTSFVMLLRQQVRRQTQGFNQGIFATEITLVNVAEKTMKNFGEGVGGIAHILPEKPNKIMVSVQEGFVNRGTRIASAFEPVAFYELDLESGAKSLIIKARPAQFSIAFDRLGNAIRALGYDDKNKELVYYYRQEGSNNWTEYYRLHDDSFERFDPVGIDPAAKDHLFVIAHNGEDKAGFWSYDMANKRFGDKHFQDEVDSLSAVYHTNTWDHLDEVTGIEFFSDRRRRVFFDEIEGALDAQLMTLIPNAANLNIISRATDSSAIVIFNSGPKDPGTYFLFHNGKLTVLGSLAPDINSENLSEVRYVTYESTDGMKIRGYVTIPVGEPPFPLVVLPHGGPHVAETVSYDPWGQMLANHGYMVLQPQYRGSHNYGINFYKASFDGEESQAGRMMQTDKDAGALYLVEQGLADPDRLAMVGWSYGGYASLIATIRDPQIYQCAVAGAAVADPVMQLNNYRYQLSGAQKEEQFGTWETAVSPIDEAEKVNIPLLLIHGDGDARVSLDHVTKYRRLLDRHEKDYEYIELKGAAHFYSTLNYNHREQFYGAMLRFLKEDCGPDGL